MRQSGEEGISERVVSGIHEAQRVLSTNTSFCLTFAFFSPKVPVEIFSEWRRRMALTKRQKEVLDYLVAFETKHGYAPSFEEIGKGLKLTSLATVHKHITTLEKKGFIRRGYNQSRSIEILQ